MLNIILRFLWTKSKDSGRRISQRFSIAADFENIKAANSISQKQERIAKNNPNLEHDPVQRQGSWRRSKASAPNGQQDEYRHATKNHKIGENVGKSLFHTIFSDGIR